MLTRFNIRSKASKEKKTNSMISQKFNEDNISKAKETFKKTLLNNIPPLATLKFLRQNTNIKHISNHSNNNNTIDNNTLDLSFMKKELTFQEFFTVYRFCCKKKALL